MHPELCAFRATLLERNPLSLLASHARANFQDMCGRSSLHDAPVNVLEHFSLPPVLPGFEPHWNIAPSQMQWTLRQSGKSSLEPRLLRWGLVPSWASDASSGSRMINARAESLGMKPAFRDALASKRCIVLADGYYEWTAKGKTKVPMYFHLAGNRAFGLAGLWDRWIGPDGPLETCTIITTAAGSRTSAFHHRMPVVLTLEGAASWLDAAAPVRSLGGLLAAYEGDDLHVREVTRFVNNPANDTAECIMPPQPGESLLDEQAILR